MYLELKHEGDRWRIPVDRVDGFGGLLQVWPTSKARLASLDHGGVAYCGMVPMPVDADGRPVAVLIRPRDVGAEWRVYAPDGALTLAIDNGIGISDVLEVRRVAPCGDGVMISGDDVAPYVERPDSMGKGALWTVSPVVGGSR